MRMLSQEVVISKQISRNVKNVVFRRLYVQEIMISLEMEQRMGNDFQRKLFQKKLMRKAKNICVIWCELNLSFSKKKKSFKTKCLLVHLPVSPTWIVMLWVVYFKVISFCHCSFLILIFSNDFFLETVMF